MHHVFGQGLTGAVLAVIVNPSAKRPIAGRGCGVKHKPSAFCLYSCAEHVWLVDDMHVVTRAVANIVLVVKDINTYVHKQ